MIRIKSEQNVTKRNIGVLRCYLFQSSITISNKTKMNRNEQLYYILGKNT